MEAKIEFENTIAPVEGKELSWENLEYYVHKHRTLPLPRNTKIGPLTLNNTNPTHILHSNSGVVPPGSFMAILGSSGAGKTTFLNALAQQYDENGELRGSIHIGEHVLTKKKFSTFCGYVRQEDTLLPNCTVQETLDFYARLRLPSSMSRKERRDRVRATMQKLGLTHCANTLVGGKTKKGISGGEKRRVSIAVELIRNPTILFLDEPTSGLDSRTSLSVVSTLVDLAHLYNHTIVCTIHQPRSQIYNLFDYLMILAKGRQIYFGRCNEAIPYFDQLGYSCPKQENPADFFIDILTIDSSSTKTTEESNERVDNIIEAAAQHPHIHTKHEPVTDDGNGAVLNENNQGGAGYVVQVYLLTKRTLTNTIRDKPLLIGRFAQNVLLAAMVLILFFQMDNDQTSIQDRISVVFMCLLGTTFSEAVAATLIFPIERPVYQRERASRMYRISAYYIAKTISEFPLQLAMPLIFVVTVYYGVGLRSPFGVFVEFCVIVVALVFAINSWGMLVGALVPGPIAAMLAPSSLIIFLLAAGFYIHPDNIPVWLAWIVYPNPFYHAFNAAIVNQFSDVEFYCKSDQFVEYSELAVCSDGERVLAQSSFCPITNGDQIVDRYSADDIGIWYEILILLSFMVFFRSLVYLALRNVNPKEMDIN